MPGRQPSLPRHTICPLSLHLAQYPSLLKFLLFYLLVGYTAVEVTRVRTLVSLLSLLRVSHPKPSLTMGSSEHYGTSSISIPELLVDSCPRWKEKKTEVLCSQQVPRCSCPCAQFLGVALVRRLSLKKKKKKAHENVYALVTCYKTTVPWLLKCQDGLIFTFLNF